MTQTREEVSGPVVQRTMRAGRAATALASLLTICILGWAGVASALACGRMAPGLEAGPGAPWAPPGPLRQVAIAAPGAPAASAERRRSAEGLDDDSPGAAPGSAEGAGAAAPRGPGVADGSPALSRRWRRQRARGPPA